MICYILILLPCLVFLSETIYGLRSSIRVHQWYKSTAGFGSGTPHAISPPLQLSAISKKIPGYQLPDLSQTEFPNLPEQGYYDLIVLGSGPAGESAAVRAAQLGAKVAIIEKKSSFGGPTGLTSKAVREACKKICVAVDSIGVADRKAKIKELWRKLFPVLKTEAEVLQAAESRERLKKNGIDLFVGVAKFVPALHSPNFTTVRICRSAECIEVDAAHIVICTGSRPYRPEQLKNGVLLPFQKGKVVCSTEMGSLPVVPNSAAIIGGGVIAVEYATVLSELGVGVSLLCEKNAFLPFLERGLRESLKERMTKRGHILFVTEPVSSIVAPLATSTSSDRRVQVSLAKPMQSMNASSSSSDGYVNVKASPQSPERKLKVDLVVFSGGRLANSEDLDCEAMNIAIGKYGRIEVDSHFRTSAASNIYAVGDVIGSGLASQAVCQGRKVVNDIFTSRADFELSTSSTISAPQTSNSDDDDDDDGFDDTTEQDGFFASAQMGDTSTNYEDDDSTARVTLFGSDTGTGMDAPLTLWTIPEIASVGLSLEQASKDFPAQRVIEGFAFFNETARGRLSGDRDGYLKVVIRQETSKRHLLCGIHIIGEGANELIQLGSVMIHAGFTAEQVVNTPFAAVTMSALFQMACDDALGRIKRLSVLPP